MARKQDWRKRRAGVTQAKEVKPGPSRLLDHSKYKDSDPLLGLSLRYFAWNNAKSPNKYDLTSYQCFVLRKGMEQPDQCKCSQLFSVLKKQPSKTKFYNYIELSQLLKLDYYKPSIEIFVINYSAIWEKEGDT